jgi:hypothetical protein
MAQRPPKRSPGSDDQPLLDDGQHCATADPSGYLAEMARDTFESWQSEFHQLLWQMFGIAYFLYVGLPRRRKTTIGSKPRLMHC